MGMSCASCASRIEGAQREVSGVDSAIVNFSTARATVTYQPAATTPESLRDAVRGQGYGLLLPAVDASVEDIEDVATMAQEDEYRRVRTRFLVAAVHITPAVFLAMAGHAVPSLEAKLSFPARGPGWRWR